MRPQENSKVGLFLGERKGRREGSCFALAHPIDRSEVRGASTSYIQSAVCRIGKQLSLSISFFVYPKLSHYTLHPSLIRHPSSIANPRPHINHSHNAATRSPTHKEFHQPNLPSKDSNTKSKVHHQGSHIEKPIHPFHVFPEI